MPYRVVLPSRTEKNVLSEAGEQISLPEDWAFLPSGDAAITRSVKAKGQTWVVREQRGRRRIFPMTDHYLTVGFVKKVCRELHGK